VDETGRANDDDDVTSGVLSKGRILMRVLNIDLGRDQLVWPAHAVTDNA
jgi:hypothetical protein